MQNELNQIKALALKGKKLQAIKALKRLSNLGLKQSKEIVDGLEDGSMTVEHATQILMKYNTISSAVPMEDDTRNDVRKPNTLIKKSKKSYTIPILFIIIALLLAYIFYAR